MKDAEKLEDLQNKVLIEDAVDAEKGIVVARAFEPLSKAVVKQIAELGVSKIKVVDTTVDDGIIIKCMKRTPPRTRRRPSRTFTGGCARAIRRRRPTRAR